MVTVAELHVGFVSGFRIYCVWNWNWIGFKLHEIGDTVAELHG
jgi:hypothetical protein